jgi:hypothetical protein
MYTSKIVISEYVILQTFMLIFASDRRADKFIYDFLNETYILSNKYIVLICKYCFVTKILNSFEIRRRFGGTYNHCIKSRKVSQASNQVVIRFGLLIDPADDGRLFRQNIDEFIPNHTALRHRREYTSK